MKQNRGQELDFTRLEDEAILALIAGRHTNPADEGVLSSAVGALYDRYGRLVYSVALHVVGDEETAQEITQDVFVRAWEAAPGYRVEVARVSTWLVSITRHRAIDELRKRGSRPTSSALVWGDEAPVEKSLMADGPEGVVEGGLMQQDLRQAVAALPPDQRRMLGLAFFKGLSHSQIAEEVGEPLGTVKSRIRLAMQKLKTILVEKGIEL